MAGSRHEVGHGRKMKWGGGGENKAKNELGGQGLAEDENQKEQFGVGGG